VKIRQLDDAGGRRTFVLVCDRGDDPVEALTAAAKRYDLRAASLTGIGAFAAVTLGFFDHARRDYRRRVIREQVEVVSLLGNIALDRGEPRVHAHVVVGRADGGALGGHLLGGSVEPTLEVTLVEPPATLQRKTDPATGRPDRSGMGGFARRRVVVTR
jgi:predicted DNA-binding protein with PD1-like motif